MPVTSVWFGGEGNENDVTDLHPQRQFCKLRRGLCVVVPARAGFVCVLRSMAQTEKRQIVPRHQARKMQISESRQKEMGKMFLCHKKKTKNIYSNHIMAEMVLSQFENKGNSRP